MGELDEKPMDSYYGGAQKHLSTFAAWEMKEKTFISPKQRAGEIMVKLDFGECRNCGHQVVKEGKNWLHHITRSKLMNLPHWPAGHVISAECNWDCECKVPELDQAKNVKSRIVYIGKSTEK